MTIEKLLEKIPAETRCSLTPKDECDVVTIAFPKSKEPLTAHVALNIWLLISCYINANRKAKEKGARHERTTK